MKSLEGRIGNIQSSSNVRIMKSRPVELSHQAFGFEPVFYGGDVKLVSGHALIWDFDLLGHFPQRQSDDARVTLCKEDIENRE